MGVRKEVTVQHGFSREEIAEGVKAVLSSLWGFTQPHPAIFESDIGTTWSWGERFTVDITREGIIKIDSVSKVPTALFDFGKNRENLKRFFNALKHTFSTSGLAKSKPEAYSSFLSDENTYIEKAPPTFKLLSLVLISAIVIYCIAIFLLALFFGILS